MSRLTQKKNLDNFLNAKKTIELPSNLLTLKKDIGKKGSEISDRQTKIINNQPKFPKAAETQKYIEQKSQIPEKSVLYKRLSNIRGQNRELGNLSFSKMLSRMVVMGQQDQQIPIATSFQKRLRQTSYVRPIEQKLYNIKCESVTGRLSKSIDMDEVRRPSRKLFKKYYMPNSEAAQTIFLQNYNKNDKYIYKDGRRVECKRIHNFYTSHMFRKGYDKCFRKTVDSFHGQR